MDRFMFSPEEIQSHATTPAEWHEFVRLREAELALQVSPVHQFERALEIGAGNGVQSEVLARYCRHLVCTEVDPESHAWQGTRFLERNLPNVEYLICNAEGLSQFSDQSFDLVFSSNLLEHIRNIDACLRECFRVLKPGGLMLHTMPSRVWKVFKVALSPIALRRPKIHGVSSSHLQEFIAFGSRHWVALFLRHGFHVTSVKAFPFYFGHGPRFAYLLKLGNRLGWPGSFLYVVVRLSAENVH